MGTDVTLWTGRALERQHARELQNTRRRAEQAETEINCIVRVGQHGMNGAVVLNLTRADAERIAMDGAAHYAMITTVAVAGIAQAVARVPRV